MRVSEASSSNMLSDPISDRHTIANDCFEATFQPLAGGRMLRLRHVGHGDLLVPLHDASFHPVKWPKAGAFPLFPFHNRLRGAAFRYDGRLIRLRPNAANGADVMHGPAHLRPWRVTEKDPDFIEMALAYRADDEWPFDFTATQRFELHEDHLSVDLTLTNTSGMPTPGGIGWHPYFQAPRDGQVVIDAANPWDPVGQKGLPERMARDSGTGSCPIEINSTQHYSNWTEASAWIGDDTKITLSGNSRLSYLVVHWKAEYLCLEPASHVSGAFATLPELSPETGLCLLAPGETLAGTARLHVDRP